MKFGIVTVHVQLRRVKIETCPGSALASYPSGQGEGRRERMPGAHCLRMCLIKSPCFDDDIFMWVGFWS